MSASDIAARVHGRLLGDPAAPAERVLTDSRAAVRPGDVFVGLRGPHFDGADFATAALEQGASVAVVDRELEPGPGQAVIVVGDGLDALRALARHARERLRGTVVGITGSNGKTTVKDMLVAALQPLSVSASPMSWNSQVGVPLALLQADPEAEVVLVECGISEPAEMQVLEELVQPDLGVWVNVGDAHLEGLGSRAVTAREKGLLFRRCSTVFVPEDQALAREQLGDRAQTTPVGIDFLATDRALALAVARHLGATDPERGLESWRPAPMRLEISRTPQGVVLLNDAYTSDPESVIGALGVLMRERSEGRAIAVLGGLGQQGSAEDAGVRRVARALSEHGVDRVLGVGHGGAAIVRAARHHGIDCEEAVDVEAASAWLGATVRPGDRVLLKGSRPDRLERLAPLFFTALAPAVLTVDLDAVVRNFQRIQRKAGVPVMPVVKAAAYGLDSGRIALALQHAGAQHFAVAYPDEGVELRRRGIVRPILVQNVVPAELEKVVEHGLSVQVADAVLLERLEREGERQHRGVRVHLKVDTGMGRAGCAPQDAPALAARIEASSWCRFDALMTHFAAADEPDADAFTQQQIDTFRQVVEQLPVQPRWIHASNSAGIHRFDARFSMVRSGLALYGYAGFGNEPVLRLVTRVVSVKTVPQGHPVGYGRTWTAPGDRRIAVVALGYGDGYPWALSNKAWMTVGGHRCPVVGRVCMDVTMLDVTEAGEVAAGDPVTVFGGDGPALEWLAEQAGTIPYELLTRLTPRIRRIFESSL